jgi:hypothetical protein
MAYRASGLTLVVNAIILWNTVYLSRAVDYIRSQGIVMPDEVLCQVAPLPWAHIALTGDYLWNEIDRPSNASGRPAPAASIQTTSNSLSGYYCRNAHGAPHSSPHAVQIHALPNTYTSRSEAVVVASPYQTSSSRRISCVQLSSGKIMCVATSPAEGLQLHMDAQQPDTSSCDVAPSRALLLAKWRGLLSIYAILAHSLN